MYRASYLVFVYIIILVIKTSRGEPQVHLSVYYESRCPDSKRFVLRQLQPTIQLLHKYIQLEFIPFGKANSINAKSFQCQHGPPECLGNMIQGCTINLMEGRASDAQIVDYVACEFLTDASPRNDLRCVRKTGVNRQQVLSCMSGPSGIALQKKYERMTKYVRPKFIPTVVFDNNFNQSLQDSAMVELTGTLCSYLQGHNLKECHHYRKAHRRRRSRKPVSNQF